MAIAATIERYLAGQGISYEVVAHSHTGDSLHTAEAAHVSGESVAKAVVLTDEQGYVVAVLPATYKLKLGEVHAFTGRRHLRLVSEEELAGLFSDCEPGAVPALAAPRRCGTKASPWRARCTSRAATISRSSGSAAPTSARSWGRPA